MEYLTIMWFSQEQFIFLVGLFVVLRWGWRLEIALWHELKRRLKGLAYDNTLR